MVIDSSALTPQDGGLVEVDSVPLGEGYYMCPDEVFADQPMAGMCSAWLVAPDIVVTNGHCVTSQADCEQKSLVFDFALTEPGQELGVLEDSQVVACEQVLAWDETRMCEVDFAVLKLARPVEDREPVRVRAPGEELAGEDLVIIGHPFGLPRKYALEGDVLEQYDNGFLTTHDIFGGNSGSAIFDRASGTVQGLATCGGSNLDWAPWSKGWELLTKTGKSCDQTCDEEGLLGDGQAEDSSVCEQGDHVLRCVCDGDQLVWEQRPCLPFEHETQGQCTREKRVSEFTCTTAPWLCATPFMQHTANFAPFVGEWEVFASEEPVEVVPEETARRDQHRA